MNILKSDLENAAQSGILAPAQVDSLWEYLEKLRPETPRFQGLHVLYYFGGILILASMSWFLTNAWDSGVGIMLISGLFGFLYLMAGRHLWVRAGLPIPGGLLLTAAAGLTPVFLFGFEKATGLWPQGLAQDSYHDYHVYVRGSWILMEVGTIAVSALLLRFFDFPFLTFPLSFSLWYLSMDLTPILFGITQYTFDDRKWVSVVFGLLVLCVAYAVDLRHRAKDFAFWLYFYGLLAFWGGLTAMDSNSEVNKLIYCIINLLLMFTAVYLRRRVFIVFGTIGVLAYLGHLAWQVFKDSYGFPIALAFLGIAVVYLGIRYQQNRVRVEQAVERLLPTFLQRWRPVERV